MCGTLALVSRIASSISSRSVCTLAPFLSLSDAEAKLPSSPDYKAMRKGRSCLYFINNKSKAVCSCRRNHSKDFHYLMGCSKDNKDGSI
ncbi:hypothetical protein ZWY2020_057049 [Hordeum vulgare]|nr:hypothetical protein ZWY2020_057049 [Hordeum vulgare]